MSVTAPPRVEPQPAPAEHASRHDNRRVLLAAGLAAGAAAWMLGGVFQGPLARILALVGVAAGVAWIGLSGRLPSASAAQYLLVPIAFVTGFAGALILPNSTGVTGTIPALVSRAVRSGGLLEPPVPFDPGWRFLVIALSVVIGGAAASVATGWGRPHLVLALPLPLVLGAAFVQPDGAELVSGAVSLVLMIGALMVVYTAELASSGEGMSARFELRQFARGGAAMLGVLVLLAGLNQTDLLFPDADRSTQRKPQKPQVRPLSEVKDRVLFTVRSESQGPWRLGTLDEYDGTAWLLPPFDPDRTGALEPTTGARVTATFTIAGLEGHTLPAIPNPVSIEGKGRPSYDPRTQLFRLRQGSAGDGYTYTVTGAAPPSGSDLSGAQGAIPGSIERFARIGPPPQGVAAVLAQAPGNPWERLQFVRNALYEKVVAAGSGVPADVAPDRVDELLAGDEATPYEIVAAEALLARWAGLPARIGYGFYRGTEISGGREIHPRDGANWLEAYFPGYGWVPVIGVPPRARASLSAQEKNRNVALRPADELSLQLYIPYAVSDPLLLYQVVRYWIGVALPFGVLAALVWAFAAWPLKLARSARRRRWAGARGIRDRIAVEYAEFRDAATDLGAGDPYDTPLEYVERVAPDDEHAELAWLVTRALWGDLARDLTDEDARAAETMGRSLRRRLARAQSPLARVLALSSRASIREPYDADIPNVRRVPRVRRRAAAALAGLFLIAGSCGGDDTSQLPPPRLPERVLPSEIEGLQVRTEVEASKGFARAGRQSLVADGRLYTLRSPDGLVQGALQAAVLKRAYDLDDIDVARGVRRSVERGEYRWFKLDGTWIGEQRLPELGLYLWYPPGTNTFNVLVVRPQLGIPKALLSAIMRYRS